ATGISIYGNNGNIISGSNYIGNWQPVKSQQGGIFKIIKKGTKYVGTWQTPDTETGRFGLGIIVSQGNIKTGKVFENSQTVILPLKNDTTSYYAGAGWSKGVYPIKTAKEWEQVLKGFQNPHLGISFSSVETNTQSTISLRPFPKEKDIFIGNSDPVFTNLPARINLADYGYTIPRGYSIKVFEKNGKEIPSDYLRENGKEILFIQADILPATVKELKLKIIPETKTQLVSTDLHVKKTNNSIIVTNSHLRAVITENGLSEIEINEGTGNWQGSTKWKKIYCKEIGQPSGKPVLIHSGRVVVLVKVGTGQKRRDYYFYNNSDLFNIDAPKDYYLKINKVKEVYVTLFDANCQADPTPTGSTTRPLPIAYPADWAFIDSGGAGLWFCATPGCTELQINRNQKEKTALIYPGISPKSQMTGHNYPPSILENTITKILPERVRMIFGIGNDSISGRKLLMESTPPISVMKINGQFISRENFDIDNSKDISTVYVIPGRTGKPDFLSSKWFFSMDSDNSIQCAFKFISSKDSKIPTKLNVYTPIDNGNQDGVMDSRDLKYPTAIFQDFSKNGEFVANSFFRGGIVDDGKVTFEIWNCYDNYNVGFVTGYWGEQFDLNGKPDGSIISLDTNGEGLWNIGYTGHSDTWSGEYGNGPVPPHTRSSQQGFFKFDFQKINPPRGLTIDFTNGYTNAMSGTHYGSGDYMTYWSGVRKVFDKRGFYYIGGNDWPQGTISLTNNGNAQMRWYGMEHWIDGQWYRNVQRWVFDLYRHNGNLSPYAHWDSPTRGWEWDFAIFGVQGYDPTKPVEFKDYYSPKHKIRIMGSWVPPAGWNFKKPLTISNKKWMQPWYWALKQKAIALVAYYDNKYREYQSIANPEAYQFWSVPGNGCYDIIKSKKPVSLFPLYYSSVDAHWHIKGAKFGYEVLTNDIPKIPEGKKIFYTGTEDAGVWAGDVEFVRPWATYFEACFARDKAGYMNTFLLDKNNDGFYGTRAWINYKTGQLKLISDNNLYEEKINITFPHTYKLTPKDYFALSSDYRKHYSQLGKGILQTFLPPQNPLHLTLPWTKVISASQAGIILLDSYYSPDKKPVWSNFWKNGYSRLFTSLSEFPLIIENTNTELTTTSLNGVKLLVILQPSKEPAYQDINIIDDYLKNGGRLIFVCGNNQQVANKWINNYGISLNTQKVEFNYKNDPFVKNTGFDDSKFFSGNISLLKKAKYRIYFSSGSGLNLSSDKNTKTLLKFEKTPLIVEKNIGKGQVIIISNKTIINNLWTAYNTADGRLGRIGNTLTQPNNNNFIDALLSSLLKE
ncbi:MAG: DUF4861 family protein, partial [Candidatus Omnitrophica bacterium]|nr:DUF4861 family protein [Candidatus Omnitrophota bacterium]